MGKNESSWIPPDARYSIIYELEYVESCQGCYPSTEGFLILLKALFVAGGSPLFLGQNWRSRPGCAPYVEYVINYILPRATGHFEHFPALPFRSSEDKSRLLLFALEVVDTVLIRYTVPVPRQDLKLTLEEQALESHKCAQNAATALIGNIVLGEDITVQPHVDDFRAFVVDFRSTEVSPPQDALSTSQSISSRSPVPPPKSPGFSVLAALLSASEHKLLRALVSCLFDFNVDTALHDFDMISMASTLYGNTPPTFASAKEGTMNTRRSMSRRLLVKSLRPEYVCMEKESYGQRAILVSLRILCVALAREDLFRDRANAEVGRISVVPVLRFSRYTLVPHSFDMDLLQVSQLLLSPDVTKGIVPTIVHLVGTVSANKRTDVEISSAAIALTFHIEQSIPRQDNAVGNVLRTALSRKVLEISRNPMSDSDLKFLHFVFDRLLLELRGKTSFAFLTEELFTNESTYQGRQDFLGSILSLLQSIDLAGDGVNLSPCICEVLYRLMATKTGSSDVGLALFTSTRLRAVDFWKTILVRIFSFLSANENYLESTTKDCLTHSVAWLLKGAAAELYLLIGFPNDFPLRLGDTRLLTAKASQFNILCRHLFSDIGFVAQALSILPIEILPTTRESFPSPDERTVGEAKQAIRGSPDVVNGYYTINAELLKIDARADQLLPNVKELNTWIDNWNHSVLRDCASAHLSHAIALVISSSMAGSEIMDFSLPQGCKVGVHTAIDILKRMDSMMASVACLDSFYLTACRNLVYAVRIATTSLEKNMDGSELALLGNLIIRGIASQASVNYQGPVANRRKELISDFACSLVHTIRAMNFPFFTRTDQDCIIRAATVLSELSGIVEIGHTVERTSSESLASRACLPMLLEILEETSSSDLSSPSCSVLTSTSGSSLSSTLMTSLLGLLPLFDDTVVCLLQRMVGLSPHVAALFRAHGIIEAIQNAATKYCDQEKTYLSLKSHGVQNRATQIQAPSFLVGHFELLSAVLASCSTREQKIDIASKIFSISQTYKPLLDRLLTTFPVDGDSLYAMLRCIAQCNALLYSKCGPTGSDTIDGFLIGDYLPVSLIASLAMHIAENPLPERFLGATPSRLQQPHVSIGVVVVQKTVQTSWWDGHDKPTASLIDGHVRLAALAMDLLRWMLTLIRRSSTETALNEFVLSRSILRCSSSALVRATSCTCFIQMYEVFFLTFHVEFLSSELTKRYEKDGNRGRPTDSMRLISNKLNAFRSRSMMLSQIFCCSRLPV